jgi:hypothetical protein
MTPDEELEHTISEHGEHYLYLKGNLHREDGPAVICRDGTGLWYGIFQKREKPKPTKINWKKEGF